MQLSTVLVHVHGGSWCGCHAFRRLVLLQTWGGGTLPPQLPTCGLASWKSRGLHRASQAKTAGRPSWPSSDGSW
jgi:hypothetical protein